MGLLNLFKKKGNKRNVEPKNKNKVPTSSNRVAKKLVYPSQTPSKTPTSSASSTPSNFQSLHLQEPLHLVTSTPKNKIKTAPLKTEFKQLKTNFETPISKHSVLRTTQKGSVARPKTTLGLTYADYSSYDEDVENLEIKEVANIKTEKNNNIVEHLDIRPNIVNTRNVKLNEVSTKNIEISVIKHPRAFEKNTVSKEQKLVKRNIETTDQNDILVYNRKAVGVAQPRNKGFGGLFDVNRRRERDKANKIDAGGDYSSRHKDKLKPQSTISLTSVRPRPKASNLSVAPSKSRPISVPSYNSKSNLKRGHGKDTQNRDGGDISRTSSVTNLESLESQGQGGQPRSKPPKKSGSKERVDKDGKKGLPKTNNNQALLGVPVAPPVVPPHQPQSFLHVDPRIEPGFHSYSSDSLQDAEIHQLRRQLKEMADEKSSLALQLGEQRGQLNSLQKEILKLKSFQEESTQEIEKLSEENTTLRNRLRDVAHSPLSDNEKQQLLFENAHMMQSSSAPASIATNILDDTAGGDITTCTTPDWDKHSSSNVSEVSVACLQDKINQMQETHYSTNEELQATLQELTDLQRQLTDLQQENERLNEEKTLMFDSLCRQTERLNDSRQEVESLKQMLYRDRSDETAATQLENVVEREQKLVELLRSAQEEREGLMLKLDQIQTELHDSRAELIDKTNLITQLSERVKTLECSMDAKHAEHKQMDQELAQAKDQCSSKQIEINRLTDLLENARTKINEIEQDRTLSDKSELDELLDNARKEKDQLESEVAYLKEQLARSKNEIEKLKEQVFVLQEECKVTRNNAKTTQSDLEYKCEKLILEKNGMAEQLQQFQEALNELQVQSQCHVEDKRQLSAVLSETQRNLSETERKSLNLETEIQELKKLRTEENEEWEKFKNDLLTSVRVANDFKTEAYEESQKIILENKSYREKVRLLEGQLEKLKGEKTSTETQTEVVFTPQLINLVKNFDFPPNRPILRQESKRRHKKVVSLDSANMDTIFPVLSKERRSKSREHLDNIKKNQESINKSSSSKSNKIQLDKENLNISKEDSRRKSQENLQSKEVKKSKFGNLFRGKSSENLVDSEKEYDPELEAKEKFKKSKFKFGKSGEHLDNFEKEVHRDLQKPAPDETSKKGNKLFEKQRKKSIDSLDSNDTLEKDKKSSDFFSRFVKKREKKPQNRSNITQHLKFMSVEEEMLMQSLDNWYEHIDKTVPEELLSKEDKAIKKLKILYEDEQLKEKPIAKKPKEQLAISKPLLTSVVQNPQLEEIVKNNNLPSVEESLRDSVLEYSENIFAVDSNSNRKRPRIKSDGVEKTREKKWFGFHKSKSLDNLNYLDDEEVTDPLKLYRTKETENLNTDDNLPLKIPKPVLYRYSSEIQPYDSVSNPRHSSRDPEDHVFKTQTNKVNFTPALEQHTKVIYEASQKYPESIFSRHPDSEFLESFPHHYEPKSCNDLPKPNIYINYENLDQIIAEIPKNATDSNLTEEQKFALKLKFALDDAENKTSIKKRKIKSLRNLEISPPTKESVEKNWKLKEIILNPHIKSISDANKRFSDFYVGTEGASDKENRRHSANIEESFEVVDDFATRESIRSSSKSYDITFSFAPENQILKMFYPQEQSVISEIKPIKKSQTKESESSSSSYSYTSAEFNLDTGNISKTIQDTQLSKEVVVSNIELRQENPLDFQDDIKNDTMKSEDLLYNETLNKKEQLQSIEPATDDLGYNETLVKKIGPKATKIEIIEQDPRIEEAEKKYKKELQDILHRMAVEEKIKPFLHPRVPKHKAQLLHVHYQEPESVTTLYNMEEAVITHEGEENFVTDKNDNIDHSPSNPYNDSCLTYRSSDVSRFLDSSTDSLFLTDSSHDFIHSSAFADQESKNNFEGLSQCGTSLDMFLNETRPIETKNNVLVTETPLSDFATETDTVLDDINNLDKKNIDDKKNPEQYTYQEMIKENKYGVVSPYEVRYSYKNVVTEIKRKFSTGDIAVPDYLKEGKSYDGEETSNKKDTFFERLQNLQEQEGVLNTPVLKEEGALQDEDTHNLDVRDYINLKTEGISQIDKEMQEIMEKYLHTRASLIVKKNYNKEPTITRSEEINTSTLKKYENVENLHKIKVFENDSSELNLNEKSNKNSLSDDDFRFVEGMQKKYDFENNNEEYQNQEIPKLLTSFTPEEIEEKYHSLTQEEIDLITSAKGERFSRPLSGINERDIMLVEEISKRYVEEDNRSVSPTNSFRKISPQKSQFTEGVVSCCCKDLPDLVKTAEEINIPVTCVDPSWVNTSLIAANLQQSVQAIIKPKTLPLNTDSLPPLSPLSPLSDQESNFCRAKSNPEFRTSSLKQSLIPVSNGNNRFGSLPPQARKTKVSKTLGSHFQRKSLDVGLTYQPVYGSKNRSLEANSSSIYQNRKTEDLSNDNNKVEVVENKPLYENIGKPKSISVSRSESIHSNIPIKSKLEKSQSERVEKKPVPKPRIKSQSSFSGLTDILPKIEGTSDKKLKKEIKTINVGIDKNENVINMFDNNKNSSRETKIINAGENIEIPPEENCSLSHYKEDQDKLKQFSKSDIVQAKVIYLDDTESVVDIGSEEFENNIIVGQKNVSNVKMNKSNDASSSSQETLPSRSSIKVLGKREELNINQNLEKSEEVEEVPRSESSVEPSDVNLFKLESEDSYNSYLEIFKDEADKTFDNIAGKQKPIKGFVLVNKEISDESCGVIENTPKIIDFVPLDDETEPYFTKEGVASVSSTLEREKTFQVLNQAKSLADTSKAGSEKIDSKKIDNNSSLEFIARTPSNFSKGSSKGQTDVSRTSFSNAKKLFEALAGANKFDEQPKPKTPPKYQVRNPKTNEKIFLKKEPIGVSKNIIRETVLLIKDGKKIPIEPKKSQNIVRETVVVEKEVSVDSKNQN